MRINNENGEKGGKNIKNLEKKIQQLEDEIFKSKNIKINEEEESEDNEFLEEFSQIDGNRMIQENLKEHQAKFPKVEEVKIPVVPEKIAGEEEEKEEKEKQQPSENNMASEEEIDEIKELE